MIVTAWDIAKACSDRLEAEASAFALPYAVTAKLRPRATLLDLEQLTLTVVPMAATTTPHDRASEIDDITIEIGVQQQCDGDDETKVENLIAFCTDLRRFWRGTRLLAGAVMWRESQNDPLFFPEHLDTLNTFSSVVAIRWSVIQ